MKYSPATANLTGEYYNQCISEIGKYSNRRSFCQTAF